MASNYSIIVEDELDLKKIKEQLNEVSNQGIDFKVHGTKDVDNLNKSMRNLDDSTKDTLLTYQAAYDIFSKTIDVIQNMVSQVYNLNAAITDLKKVSDLQGSALNDYVDQLANAGSKVARTGKPNRSEPVCCDGKAA